jgi:hypothetical protein
MLDVGMSMSIELFVLVTLVGSFIGIMIVRSKLNVNIIIILIALAIIASFPICYFLGFSILFLKIWLAGQLLVFGYLFYGLHNRYKPVRRYPGTLSKYKKNPDMKKWSSEEVQYYQSTYLAGTDESNKALLDLVFADMIAVRKTFQPYVAGMKGGSRVALYVVPNEGCLWDIEDKDGNWERLQNKYTGSFAKATSTAPQSNDYEDKQKILVGYFYVK